MAENNNSDLGGMDAPVLGIPTNVRARSIPAAFGEPGKISVAWDPSVGATAYEATLWHAHYPEVRVISQDPQCEIQMPAELRPSHFLLRVRGMSEQHYSPYGPPDHPMGLLVMMVGTPVPEAYVTRRAESQASLIVSWPSVPNAVAYRLRLNGDTDDRPLTLGATVFTVELDALTSVPAIAVQAIGQISTPSLIGQCEPVEQPSLDASPVAPTSFGLPGGLLVTGSTYITSPSSWYAWVPGSAFQDRIAMAVDQAPPPGSQSVTMPIKLPESLPAGQYDLWLSPRGFSLFGAAGLSFTRLAPPSALRYSLLGDEIEVAWDPVLEAESYTVQWTPRSGSPTVMPDLVEPKARLPRLGGHLTLAVQAVGGANDLTIRSAPAQAEFGVSPKAPTGLTLTPCSVQQDSSYVAGLQVAWDGQTGAAYSIVIGRAGAEPTGTYSTSDHTVAVPLPSNSDGPYEISITATVDGILGEPATIVTSNLDAPRIVDCAFSIDGNDEQVWVAWDPVPGAASYWCGIWVPGGGIEIVSVTNTTVAVIVTWKNDIPPAFAWVRAISADGLRISSSTLQHGIPRR